MERKFPGIHAAAFARVGAYMTVILSAHAATAEMPARVSGTPCAQWQLSATDFRECQRLWSTARDDAARRDIQKRFQARSVVIPGSRIIPPDDAAGGTPADMSASPSK